MRDAWYVRPCGKLVVAELAFRQHGVVALGHLTDLGFSASTVRGRVASGRLHRVHAGVYAVGHERLSSDGRYLAAVLACGPDAGLSHRSCADKRGLRQTSRSATDVSSPRQAGRRRRGIDAHTSTTLLPHDFELVNGIRCATVARMLLDLAAVAPRRVVERVFDEADVRRVLDARQIDDVLARAGGHRGAGVLRAVYEHHVAGSTLTRNDLEEAFLAICRHGGLPAPAVNAWIALEPIGSEADFLWRDRWLIAEVDGRDVHTTRRAFDDDRRRDQRLMLAGYRVVRFTWRRVVFEPYHVESAMRSLLAQAA